MARTHSALFTLTTNSIFNASSLPPFEVEMAPSRLMTVANARVSAPIDPTLFRRQDQSVGGKKGGFKNCARERIDVTNGVITPALVLLAYIHTRTDNYRCNTG